MAVTYGLWRPDSPLNVSVFASELEALAAVRAAVAQRGPAFVTGWSLVRIPGRGEWITLAEGEALLQRAADGPSNGLQPPRSRTKTRA